MRILGAACGMIIKNKIINSFGIGITPNSGEKVEMVRSYYERR